MGATKVMGRIITGDWRMRINRTVTIMKQLALGIRINLALKIGTTNQLHRTPTWSLGNLNIQITMRSTRTITSIRARTPRTPFVAEFLKPF